MHEDGNNPAEVRDAALLARIAAGDEDAFVALYRRYASGVNAFALALSKSRSVAQDVTQEVLLNAARVRRATRTRAERLTAHARHAAHALDVSRRGCTGAMRRPAML